MAPAPSARPARMLVPERLALALLALSGAAFLPDALNRFVFPKLVLVAIAVTLAAIVPARGRLPRAAVAVLCAGAALLTLAALSGRTPLQQLIGLAPRYEGLIVLPLYAGAGVAGARLLGHGRARGASRSFVRWLALAAILIGIEAVLEAAGLRPLASNVARPGSLLGNASDEGAWAVLALGPLAAVAIRVGGGLFTAGAVMAAATVICSGSRAALLGALIVAAVLVVLAGSRAVRVAVLVGIAAMAVGTLALPATRARVTASGGQAGATVTGRRLLWSETTTLVVGHPLLGIGPSGYLDAIPKYHGATYEREVGPQNPPDSPHDWLLQATVAGGLPLLALALALAGLTLRRGWRAVAEQETAGEAALVGGLLAGLCGYGVALLFGFTTPGSTPLAAVFGGALLAGVPASAGRGDRRSRLWRRVRPAARAFSVAVCCALAVLAAAGAVAEVYLRDAIDAAASDHLTQSEHEFQTAHDLRPWDPSVDATAAHAYATLAGYGIVAAIRPGLHWSGLELARLPHSIEALSDAATLALAAGQPARARRFVDQALRLEPENPVLRRLAAELGS
ncbi:MAG: O-antigen ligase family protein [Solirubrobacteraceae bacterium]